MWYAIFCVILQLYELNIFGKSNKITLITSHFMLKLKTFHPYLPLHCVMHALFLWFFKSSGLENVRWHSLHLDAMVQDPLTSSSIQSVLCSWPGIDVVPLPWKESSLLHNTCLCDRQCYNVPCNFPCRVLHLSPRLTGRNATAMPCLAGIGRNNAPLKFVWIPPVQSPPRYTVVKCKRRACIMVIPVLDLYIPGTFIYHQTFPFPQIMKKKNWFSVLCLSKFSLFVSSCCCDAYNVHPSWDV